MLAYPRGLGSPDLWEGRERGSIPTIGSRCAVSWPKRSQEGFYGGVEILCIFDKIGRDLSRRNLRATMWSGWTGRSGSLLKSGPVTCCSDQPPPCWAQGLLSADFLLPFLCVNVNGCSWHSGSLVWLWVSVSWACLTWPDCVYICCHVQLHSFPSYLPKST